MRFQQKIFITLAVLLMGPGFLMAQTKRLISGNIMDAVTKEPLPFVTVSLKKQLIGVVTNEEGKFDLYVPGEVTSDTLFVNYLGYKHFFMDITTIKEPVTIKLEETVVQLEEIVVKSLSPEAYIQMAMQKIKQNYPKDPFQTDAYYREKVLENKSLIKCDEGVFKTYYLSLIDTTKPQNQLLLFRRATDPQAVTFMSESKKKFELKDSKNKKNSTAVKDSTGVKDSTDKKKRLTINLDEFFGGPSEILKSSGISHKPRAFLDSLQFKHFKYSFARSSTYNTNELMVIDFETRGKVNNVREKGKIYIDLNSRAIVKIECSGNFILPAIIRPVLFVMNMRIKNPTFETKSEFQLVDGKWYPKNIQNNIDLKLINWHWFRKNDRSTFEAEQYFFVNDLKTIADAEIPAEKRFDPKKEMEKQVYNDNGLTWEGLNIIKPESAKQ